MLMAENNTALAISNHLSRLKLSAKVFRCGNEDHIYQWLMGQYWRHISWGRHAVNVTKCRLFSLLTDGSNDTGLEKNESFDCKDLWREHKQNGESIFGRVVRRDLNQQQHHQFSGSSVGAVVRALAFHQCGPGSIPRSDVICGLSLCSERFFPGYSGFLLSPKKTNIWFDFLSSQLVYGVISPPKFKVCFRCSSLSFNIQV